MISGLKQHRYRADLAMGSADSKNIGADLKTFIADLDNKQGCIGPFALAETAHKKLISYWS